MPHVAVAPDARDLFKVACLARDRYRFDHLLVAVTARLFRHVAVALGYLYRLMETARGEIIRMPETVRGLCVIFPDEVVRRVAVVAGGDGVMARFLPAVILLVHHVAVGARARIVAQIRVPFSVNKRVRTDPRRQPDSDPDDDPLDQIYRHPYLYLRENKPGGIAKLRR
jgi:hypothetical protein